MLGPMWGAAPGLRCTDAMPRTDMNHLDACAAYRSEAGWEVLAEFARLLRMPNVTGELRALRANADAVAQLFGRRGARMRVVELPGASPVVIGRLPAQDPTAALGMYVHYDGQPVDAEAWHSDPFAAALASAAWHEGGEHLEYPGPGDPIDPGWRIYARGAADDKAPFAALLSAVDALDAAGIERTVDLVFLFEGEEESGSPHLNDYMSELADELRADAWLLCDGPVHQTRDCCGPRRLKPSM